jgi:regulator of protease activity HflC (stomatin/prohibitin superfamily)
MRSVLEMPVSEVPNPMAPHSNSTRNPYRGVVFVLLGAALLGACAALFGGFDLGNPVLLDTAVTLGISTGVLVGVAVAQALRAKPQKTDEHISMPPEDQAQTSAYPPASSNGDISKKSSRLIDITVFTKSWIRDLGEVGIIRVSTGAAGMLAILGVLFFNPPAFPFTPLVAAAAAALCLGAAGLAATAVPYLGHIEASEFPEAPGLSRGALVVFWFLVLASVSIGLEWAGQRTAVRILHVALQVVNAALCYGLLVAQRTEERGLESFPLNLDVLTILGSRPNVLASILDAAERQLGIDLRSTWALTIVRRSLEPLIIVLSLIGWLSTSLTVVGLEEQGLVERLGVPVAGQPLPPGLHLHWPWPVDQVFRIPVRRVQALQVGHEGEEQGGPENVLWAVEHAPNEYTLLLGNGRDLITVDAAVQFRIVDARAWRYDCQNPADALRAIAYRTVMRSTVNRTLSEALSENVATLTRHMRDAVQTDANALGLGVEVEGFTVGGMHPPVPVASDYEAVVSAELGKVTAVANAQTLRNQVIPAAEASVLTEENAARADAAVALARAAGEAWSFRTLESQYVSAPQEYFFRRRLETLEKSLTGRHFIVLDSRFQRDGGELWLTQ